MLTSIFWLFYAAAWSSEAQMGVLPRHVATSVKRAFRAANLTNQQIDPNPALDGLVLNLNPGMIEPKQPVPTLFNNAPIDADITT